MDMVAYQVKDVLGLQVYTTLIISCKKSDKNVWALLSRDRERDDPNVDWSPTHIWSNDRALAFATSQSSWPEQYYARTRELGVQRVSSEPEVDIFGTDLCEARRGDLIGREGLGGRGLMLPRVVA
jgi:hypothetical protein